MTTPNVGRDNEAGGLGCGSGLPGLACEARDLKRIMTHLAQQIAEADRRHSEALARVQERLELIGDTTQGLRGRMPHEMTGVLDRIEDRMARMSDRIAESGQQRRPAGNVPSAAALAAAAASPPRAEIAPALRSALAGRTGEVSQSLPTGRPLGQQAIDTFDVVDRLDGRSDAEAWDTGMVDALAKLYEGGIAEDTGTPALDAVTATTSPAPVALPERDGPPPKLDGSLSLSTAAGIAAELSALQSKTIAGEREWLEQRFADVALRLEQSLDGLKANGSFETIEQRFSQLEQRLEEVMGDAARSTDLASLKSIEAQVEDLNAQLYTVQTHFGRLDTIELELRGLAERMSSDSLARMLAAAPAKGPDSEAIAGAVASRVAQQMPRIEETLQSIAAQLSADRIADARTPAPDVSALAMLVADEVSQRMPKQATPRADPGARLDELKATLESFVVERRHGEEQTNAMLDTMQQAMIRLLDRMDAIEQTRFETEEPHASPEPSFAASPHAVPGATSRPVPPVARMDEPPAAAPWPAEPSERPSHVPEQQAPVLAGLPENVHPTSAPSLTSAAKPGLAQQPVGSHQQAAAMTGNREDFVAAARRAARMAAESPADMHEPAQPAHAPRVETSDQSVPTKPKRQLSMVSMALICLILMGASFIAVKSTLLAPARAPAPGAAAPAAPAAATGAVKQAPNLEDADGPIDGNRSLPGQGQPRRSSLPGMGGIVEGDLDGPGSVPGGFQPLPGGAAALPAALTRDGGTGAAAPRGNELPPVAIGPTSLRNAAAKGDPSAEFEVGARYAEGRGIAQDLQQAVNWYQRAAAQGFAPAQYRLASMYERGLGVKADLARARVWYLRAAEGGVVKAMHNLAVLSAGRDTAVTDYQTAGKWFLAAAEHGLTDSQFNLAIMLDSGLGMERDTRQAYKWFSLAARAGDEEASRRRDALRHRMQPQDIAAVETEIATWRPRSADQVLNDPRLAGEGWKKGSR